MEQIISGAVRLAEPNRAECLQALGALEGSPAASRTAACKLWLTDFNAFNRLFGRHSGDLLLSQIAGYLAGLPGCRVFRTGGVEFVLIISNVTYEAARDLTSGICSRFNGSWEIGGMSFFCEMSLGAVLPPVRASGAELSDMLDAACEDAFVRGQNTCSEYTAELRAGLEKQRAVAQRLRDALSKGDDPDLEVSYRPTCSISAGTYLRADCYLRLFSDVWGLVGEAELIPVAEQSGLACALNLYEIRHACALIRRLQDSGKPFETVSVPLSAIQFLQPDFDRQITGLLEETGADPKHLALELTESTLINSELQVIEMMQKIADLGVEMVLSDFGTGYSGIGNLLQLPVGTVKLDRQLILQLENDSRTGCLMEGLISIAHKLDRKVIAEGVESDTQRQRLAGWGCDYMQGFFFSATVTAGEMIDLIGRRPERCSGTV